MNNQKGIADIIPLVLILGAGLFVVALLYKTNLLQKNTLDLRTEQVSVTPGQTLIEKPKNAVENLTYISQHPDWPRKLITGFDMNVAPGWKVSIKDVLDENSQGFSSEYQVGCTEGCLGLRLTKDSTILEMVFLSAMDNNGISCSNSIVPLNTGNNWWRITDSNGTFYSNTVTENYIPSFDNLKGTEWEVNSGETYRYCFVGYGEFLEDRADTQGFFSRQIDLLNGFDKTPVLMEFPRVKGYTDEDILKEIDGMIVTIKGVDYSPPLTN